MKFTQGQPESMQTKPNAKAKIKEGQEQIGNFAAKTAARPEVQAATRAAQDGANKAKKGLLSLFGMGDESPQQTQPPLQTGQNQFGGKRRRKSRRKKRTKRRRKSRRKKRRTKRRRKSRRKRRR